MKNQCQFNTHSFTHAQAAYIYDWLIEDSNVDDRYINEGLGLLQDLNIVNQQSKNFVSNTTVVDEELKTRWMELF